MTDNVTNTSQDYVDDVTPDSLMGDFRGRGIIAILLFTVVVHAVLLVGTSVGYLKTELLGPKKLSKEQKLKAAVSEATNEIRKIADKYDMTAQELSDAFVNNKPGPVKDSPEDDKASPKSGDGGDKQDRPKSAYEEELEKKQPGPAEPQFDEEPLF